VKQIFAGRPIVEIRTDRPVDAMQELDAMPEVEKTSLFGTALHAVLRSRDADLAAIASRLRAKGLRVDAMDAVVPSLEDVFLDVVDKAGAA
jgi:ABC-2 type transport system ATP-binding protein